MLGKGRKNLDLDLETTIFDISNTLLSRTDVNYGFADVLVGGKRKRQSEYVLSRAFRRFPRLPAI